jgi:hypothetical protein
MCDIATKQKPSQKTQFLYKCIQNIVIRQVPTKFLNIGGIAVHLNANTKNM